MANSFPSPAIVSVFRTSHPIYPKEAPFSASKRYPEYAFPDLATEPNHVYDAVRECLGLSLDSGRFGTKHWNPFSQLISPGETVLLKPNLVKELHPRDPEGWRYVLTQGSIIRAVADYVWRALSGKGKIILADAPQTDSSFTKIVGLLGLDKIRDFYRSQGLDFELIDLRREEWINREGVIVERRELPGDPYGSIAFDLGDNSEFHGHRGAGNYYGADYDSDTLNNHHTGGRHEYLIAGAAIKCDVVLSLPKLKTHKKAGITVSLKNLVGINGDKNWLPHHTEGSFQNGGDEHPGASAKHKLERLSVQRLRQLSLALPIVGPRIHRIARRMGRHIFGDTEDVIRSGNWFGNDTLWRMCLDLNKLVAYGNPDGTMRPDRPEQRKRHYVLVDGILGGEGRGPMNPDPVAAGVLVFGVCPPSVDAVCAYLMGFDPDAIPIVRNSFQCKHFSLAEHQWRDISVVSNISEWNRPLPSIEDQNTFDFEPHFGWKGRIERKACGIR